MKKIGHACISKVIVNIDTIFTGVTNTEPISNGYAVFGHAQLITSFCGT